ncbi:hypothetical protein [Streptomyces sp. C10-9-1]|uniref:hypothetical protein n=1 Tax=Streptomyces sp. C10-9-1 TaxID=1859285 RepID=UPI003D704542
MPFAPREEERGAPPTGDFEQELGAVLRRTGGTLGPFDRAVLVEGGLARGRRRVVLRRVATGGTVLALAAAGLLGGYAGGLLGPGGGERGRVAAENPVPLPSQDGAVSARRMVDTLTALLPEGELTRQSGRGSGPGPEGSAPTASVVHDDGGGAALIRVGLGRTGLGDGTAEQLLTCPAKAYTDVDDCRESTLGNGSRALVVEGYVYGRDRGAKQWRATVVTPSGAVIDVSEYNAPEEKGTEATREDPPLSSEALLALASDPSWLPVAADYLADLADQGPPPDAAEEPRPPAGPSSGDVPATLKGLMPKGTTVVEEGGDSGFGYVVVDDGRGGSRVQVNVQSGMEDLRGGLSGGETLPDGTLVSERQEEDPDQKGGRGAVGWTVDTLRPDGFRVLVMAFNAPGQGQDAVRPTPALTMAQLRALALDPAWRGLG